MSEPQSSPHARTMKNLGPLHELLLKACPPDKQGSVSIAVLATHVKVSKFAIYKWIANAKISPEKAVLVCQLSEGRVTIEDFHPYVYA